MHLFETTIDFVARPAQMRAHNEVVMHGHFGKVIIALDNVYKALRSDSLHAHANER